MPSWTAPRQAASSVSDADDTLSAERRNNDTSDNSVPTASMASCTRRDHEPGDKYVRVGAARRGSEGVLSSVAPWPTGRERCWTAACSEHQRRPPGDCA